MNKDKKNKNKITIKIPSSLALKINEGAVAKGKRKGQFVRYLCRLALNNPEYPHIHYSDGEYAEITAYLSKEFLENARLYRARHRLVTNRDFLADALSRGIAIHEQTDASEPSRHREQNKNSDSIDLVTVNAKFYLSDASIEEAELVFQQAVKLMDLLGYELSESGKWRPGSWIRDAWFKLRRVGASEAAMRRARVLEDVGFGRLSHDADIKLAKAALELIEQSSKIPGSIVLDMGSFLFLKIQRSEGQFDCYSKKLSIEERAFLNANQKILKEPDVILQKLNGCILISSDATKIEDLRSPMSGEGQG